MATLCPSIIRHDLFWTCIKFQNRVFLKRRPSCSFWLGNVFTFMKCWHWAGCDWRVKEQNASSTLTPSVSTRIGKSFLTKRPKNTQNISKRHPGLSSDCGEFSHVFSQDQPWLSKYLRFCCFFFSNAYAGLGFTKHPMCLMKELHNWDLIWAYIYSVI